MLTSGVIYTMITLQNELPIVNIPRVDEEYFTQDAENSWCYVIIRQNISIVTCAMMTTSLLETSLIISTLNGHKEKCWVF